MIGLDGRFAIAMDDVWAEIAHAKMVHTEEFHSAHEGFAVMDEERDELWDEVKRNYLKGKDGHRTVDPKAKDYVTGEHKRKMREEAIQVAAMAIRFAAEVC